MGIYLNPGKGAFEEAMRSEIFVDKTEMIRYLNTVVKTRQKYVSVSRPRRFGKTMAADMICAYYDRSADSREMFEKTKLSSENKKDDTISWDRYLGQFDVIRIVMTEFIKKEQTVSSALNRLTLRLIKDLTRAYPDIEIDPEDLGYSMEEIYQETRHSFVIVIDEWDAVFRARKEDKEGQTLYLDFLRDWLKDREYIALAYITGILPIKKYGEHSALNMFDEYSMVSPKNLAEYAGFTSKEVQDLCEERKLNYAAMKDWYDGYRLSDRPSEVLVEEEDFSHHKYEIYSPLSVVNAIRYKKLENYWNITETYEALAEYIRRDYFCLKETVVLLMDGSRAHIDITHYQNDMMTFHSKDDVLTLLIHLGYLGYDEEQKEIFIPNKEILDVFRTSTANTKEWSGPFHALELSRDLLKATWAMDEDRVAELVEEAHDKAANKTYNDEAALSYGIQLAYFAAEEYYTKALEFDSGKGYADIVYLPSPRDPDKPALLVELKYNKTVDTASDQIHRRNYPERLEHYKGNILLVSINYDRKFSSSKPGFKHHSCKIERV